MIKKVMDIYFHDTWRDLQTISFEGDSAGWFFECPQFFVGTPWKIHHLERPKSHLYLKRKITWSIHHFGVQSLNFSQGVNSSPRGFQVWNPSPLLGDLPLKALVASNGGKHGGKGPWFSCCPLRIGLREPFQMAVLWLINAGDPNHLWTGMILRAGLMVS